MSPLRIPSHRAADAASGPSAATAGFAAPIDPAAVPRAATAPALPNPALRIDPGLGLVVLEFRDAEGRVERTLPTERALAAYRTAERTAWRAAFPGEAAAADPSQANSASTPLGAAPPAAPAAATT